MLQQPGRESVVRWPLVVRSGPSADAPFAGYVPAGGHVRVGRVRPDGWFAVLRSSDGSVIGYATVNARAVADGRVAVIEPPPARARDGIHDAIERVAPLSLIAAGLALGAWVARTAIRRRPSQPCTEIICVQAKCYTGWVRTATVDRLRGAVDRYRLHEAPPHAHVVGVLVTALDKVDDRALGELARHGLRHRWLPAPGDVWTIRSDVELAKPTNFSLAISTTVSITMWSGAARTVASTMMAST